MDTDDQQTMPDNRHQQSATFLGAAWLSWLVRRGSVGWCGVAQLVVRRGSVGLVRRGSVGIGAAWLSWFVAAWLSW